MSSARNSVSASCISSPSAHVVTAMDHIAAAAMCSIIWDNICSGYMRCSGVEYASIALVVTHLTNLLAAIRSASLVVQSLCAPREVNGYHAKRGPVERDVRWRQQLDRI